MWPILLYTCIFGCLTKPCDKQEIESRNFAPVWLWAIQNILKTA